ncbi:MAG: hypothetical protein M3Z01_07925, partial [Thermoproteota archaeon]|nr:hypothetical protein [Thermoproteota archaeon]
IFFNLIIGGWGQLNIFYYHLLWVEIKFTNPWISSWVRLPVASFSTRHHWFLTTVQKAEE